MLRSKKTKLQNAHSPAQLKAQGGETKRTEEKKGKEVKAKDRKKVTAISLFLLEKKKSTVRCITLMRHGFHITFFFFEP